MLKACTGHQKGDLARGYYLTPANSSSLTISKLQANQTLTLKSLYEVLSSQQTFSLLTVRNKWQWLKIALLVGVNNADLGKQSTKSWWSSGVYLEANLC
jgi:hypothetical protein